MKGGIALAGYGAAETTSFGFKMLAKNANQTKRVTFGFLVQIECKTTCMTKKSQLLNGLTWETVRGTAVLVPPLKF